MKRSQHPTWKMSSSCRDDFEKTTLLTGVISVPPNSVGGYPRHLGSWAVDEVVVIRKKPTTTSIRSGAHILAVLRNQWPKSGCASLIFSLRATLPEKLASKKRRSTRKKFRAPIHRECVLRQSKHCVLSLEKTLSTLRTHRQKKTETESLLGGFSSVEGELCHFATTSNQCTEDTPVPETL